ncbi:hypothetical protein HPP92_003294 [Vanilla planifolia]|uniref:BZIP domain-containing protein n=1 Tax=Vanilla planifolia TaxID=51239 RepID=A0A835S765_VANPL|nr:hypothetical protein HPP92_003294 [Vanilla planifolia]
MEVAKESRTDVRQILKPSKTTISSSCPPILANRLDISSFNGKAGDRESYPEFPPALSPELSKRSGIPPIHPLNSTSHYFPTPAISTTPSSPVLSTLSHLPAGGESFTPLLTHSRILSQTSFLSMPPLPPFTSFPFPDTNDALLISNPPADCVVGMEYNFAPQTPIPLAKICPKRAVTSGTLPHNTHRRSQSDISFAFLQSSVLTGGLSPLQQQFMGLHDRSLPVANISPPTTSVKQPSHFVKSEENIQVHSDRKAEEAAATDLISAYMNLDSLDTVNSSGADEKRDDVDRSENEAESCVNERVSEVVQRKKEKNKRSAFEGPGELNMTSRHRRSISMDGFMGAFSFSEELAKLPPSPPSRPGLHLRFRSVDGTTSAFSLEFGNGEFTGAELNKIMANEKLAEIAMADPKRAKRILANRQSAARSKERKMRYISELEHKVQTLQTEATTLSAQLTLLQRDSAGLASQNHQLKFRLQAMEQKAQLRDALNEALSTELQRLKLSTGEAISDSLMLKLLQQPLEQQQKVNASDSEMKQ